MINLTSMKQRTIRHYWLYVIALQQGNYYVGITAHKDPYVRLKQHGGPYGAKWTRKYPPLRPLQVLQLDDLGVINQLAAERLEQLAFEYYRKRFGLRHVRGGRIVSPWPVYRIGPAYFNRPMLQTLGVGLLLIFFSLYIALTH